MSFLLNSFKQKSQPALEPPITAAEEKWWAAERRKHYRAALLRFSLPFFAVFAVSTALAKPEKLIWGIPVYALIVIGMGLLLGRISEPALQLREIQWKRIRESLLADSADEPAP